ncbi:MAG: hypothetical protein U9Q70_07230 [Chloroflexota bacterium]|nr:hypothetical protein [Chloroflexota bacterium]
MPLWRGWIQHAASGETCYFCYLTELLAFIEVYTGSLAQAPGAEAPRTRRGGDDD